MNGHTDPNCPRYPVESLPGEWVCTCCGQVVHYPPYKDGKGGEHCLDCTRSVAQGARPLA
jgi:hypothetical protein